MVEESVEPATSFNASEAPPDKYQLYSRMENNQRKECVGNWVDETELTVQDHKAVVDAIAGQLELTSFQKESAKRLLSDIPVEEFYGCGTSSIALAICAFPAWGDGRHYHPNTLHPSSNVETELTEFAGSEDISYTQYYRCWNRVKPWWES